MIEKEHPMPRSSQRRFAVVGFAVLGCVMVASGCGRDEAVFGDAASPIAPTVTPLPGPAATPTGSADIVPGQPRWWVQTDTPAVGRPAIEPSLPVVPGQPAFTEQDVRDYIAEHPPRLWDPTSPPPTIKRIEFLPVQEVEVRLNHFISLSTDTMLCLVTLQGTFLPPFGAALREVPDGWTPSPDAVLYRFFNAQTGTYIGLQTGVESE
jgi:hypothetical protein